MAFRQTAHMAVDTRVISARFDDLDVETFGTGRFVLRLIVDKYSLVYGLIMPVLFQVPVIGCRAVTSLETVFPASAHVCNQNENRYIENDTGPACEWMT